MDKLKLLELFEEVLKAYEQAQNYVIQDTIVYYEEEFNHEDLDFEIKEYKEKFIHLISE